MGTDRVVIRDFAYSTKSNLQSSPNTVTDPTDQEGFEGFSSPNEGSGLSPEDRSRVNRNEDGSYQVRGGTKTSGSNLDGPPAILGTYNRVRPSLQHFQYYRDPNNRDYPPSHVPWTPTGLLALPIMIDVLAVTVALTSLIRFDRDLDGPGFVHPRDDVYIGMFTFVLITGAVIVNRHITRIYNYWAEIILDAILMVAWSYVVKIEVEAVERLSGDCRGHYKFFGKQRYLIEPPVDCKDGKGFAITLLVFSSFIWILFGIHVGVFAGYIDQHRRAAGSDIYNGPNRTIIALLDSRPPRKQPRAEENPNEMTHPDESGLDT